MQITKSHLLPLTGMRFVLALWVVIFHQASAEGYLGPWLATMPDSVYYVLRTGYVAVGVFFGPSGFRPLLQLLSSEVMVIVSAGSVRYRQVCQNLSCVLRRTPFDAAASRISAPEGVFSIRRSV